MKKKILFLLLITVMAVTNIYSQQSLGHWVLVDEATITPLNQNVKNYTFYNGNIDNNNIDITDIDINTLQIFDNDKIRISDGVYDKNDNLIFYLINNKVFDVSNNEVGQLSYGNSYANTMGPELRIMQKPGTTNVYQVYYTYYVDNGQQEVDKGSFAYVDITNNNGTITIGNSEVITSSPDWNVGFALDFTVIDDWYVYYTTSSNGVYRQSILPDGTVDPNSVQEIINEDEPIIGNYHKFAAYNFELKRDEDENVVFAWVTNKDIGKGELYICKLQGSDITNKQIVKHQVSTNRINGIEFSTIEDEENVIYLSIENEGLKKLADYMSQNPTITTVSNGTSFANTYVQEGPDKSIYAVKDDGSKLGRIEYPSGVFDNSTEDMNYTTYLPGENDIKRFFLPERTGVFNMIDFTVETGYIDCECPSGEITWAQVQNLEGGESPYYFTWYNGSGTVLLEGWGEDGIENLTEGDYTVCIHDSNNPPLEECYDFSIELDPDLYTDWNMIDIYSGTANWSNESKRLKQGIYVHDGADFTIEGSNLQFGPEAKIIVDRGATLTLDNTTLTYLNQCKCLWKGIEVWGKATEEQFEFEDQYQGKLIVENNSQINNAEIAILLAKRDPEIGINYGFTGGIVQATGEQSDNYAKYIQFHNNKTVLKAVKYHNDYQGYEYDNLSFFKRCNIYTDGSFVNNDVPDAQVYLYDVKGINFLACRFTDNYHETPTILGINSLDAGFKVEGICTGQTQPCPWDDIEPSYFFNFAKAVKASSFNSHYTFHIKYTDFDANTTGVYASDVQNLSVLFSHFGITKDYSDEQECEDQAKTASGYGIYMSQCSGFAVEENNFYKYSGAPEGIYTGIYIAETQATDEVYKNYFEGLSYGNYAAGKNWSKLQENGLSYICNENTGNWEDFTVEDVQNQTDGIQDPQGSIEMPAGNTFSENANYNFNNWDYNDWIGYYYYAPSPGTTTVYYPDIINRVTREEVVGIQNQCPSHYGGGGGGSGTDDKGIVLTPDQKQESETVFYDNLNDYNNVKALYDYLKDGGNTNATLSDVENAMPDDMWELRSDLLGKSPHLSMDVLKATADKTDIFPDNVIFEIMAANPDELRKEELIKYLEDKENPLPDYMIDVLEQIVATGSTYKSILISKMSHNNRLMTRAANDIIRSLLNDTIVDNNELRNWLDKIGGKRADEQIIASYMQEGNTMDAMNLANMMPTLYAYEDDELTEHNYYTDMLYLQSTLDNEGRTIFELDSTEISNLVFIAENSNGTAGVQAKGILEFAYGYHYCNCINDDTSGFKSIGSFNYDSFNKAFGPEIEVKPNPANEWTYFNFTLPDTESGGIIKISDVTGKTIETFVVEGYQGQKIWDTRKVKQGVYLYTFTVNGISRSGKIVISK